MALTQIQQAMLADGILTADAAGRLKMADGFVNDAKISGVAASKVSGQLADSNMSPGSIIQVVGQQLFNDRVTISSASFTPVGSGLTITPQNASSRILILALASVDIAHELSIGRGANYNLPGVAHGLLTYSGSVWAAEMIQWLDSPASASAQTYYLTARGYNGSTTSVYFADFSTAGPHGWMVAMEIAG